MVFRDIAQPSGFLAHQRGLSARRTSSDRDARELPNVTQLTIPTAISRSQRGIRVLERRGTDRVVLLHHSFSAEGGDPKAGRSPD